MYGTKFISISECISEYRDITRNNALRQFIVAREEQSTEGRGACAAYGMEAFWYLVSKTIKHIFIYI